MRGTSFPSELGQTAIRLHEVTKDYPNGVRALDRVSFVVRRGEWVALTGPSGSGKTTVLNLIDGLDRPTSGSVWVLAAEMSAFGADEAAVFRRERIGLVFQHFHLLAYLTALENVMLAQYYHSLADRQEALAALAEVGLAERAHHYPAQLSGGEQQRVAIARALVNDPEILLADEPTGNLDQENERRVLELFARLHARGKTVVLATHNREVAAAASRRIELHHGRVVRDSAAEGAAGGDGAAVERAIGAGGMGRG